MYTAPSPFDDPTTPIDAQALRAWWTRQRNETQVIEPREPERRAHPSEAERPRPRRVEPLGNAHGRTDGWTRGDVRGLSNARLAYPASETNYPAHPRVAGPYFPIGRPRGTHNAPTGSARFPH